ncbi:FMN-linked oxidoreductase [Panus rudis PR-1116 ss-1]|nr:FMN-linked oxidoreductase [Panus rudis PR-1116 ss-1]
MTAVTDIEAQAASIQQPWSAYMKERYGSRKPPVLGSVNISEIEKAAREKLKDHPNAFMYTFGSAGTNATYASNLEEFRKWKIIPRMLRDATIRNIETTLFGVRYPAPLLIAPIGVQGMVHPDGEGATAKAAAEVGVPFIMSSASTRSIEYLGKANGSGHRWYQLYWPNSDDVTISILSRAKASGFTALVVTLDTMLLGWRPHDIDNAYLPFLHGVGCQVGFSDPVFMKNNGAEPVSETDYPEFPYDYKAVDAAIQSGDKEATWRMRLGLKWIEESTSGHFRTWEQLAFLRKHWDGPIVLKGIQHPQDVELAIEHGIDGVIVSNHGTAPLCHIHSRSIR